MGAALQCWFGAKKSRPHCREMELRRNTERVVGCSIFRWRTTRALPFAIQGSPRSWNRTNNRSCDDETRSSLPQSGIAEKVAGEMNATDDSVEFGGN